jgi:TolA-binding protein
MLDFKNAAEYYSKAANTYKLDSQTSDFLLNAGINYLKSGDNESAKNSFEKIKKDYNTSTAAREVEKYLSQL